MANKRVHSTREEKREREREREDLALAQRERERGARVVAQRERERERESVMAVRHSWRCGALSSAAAGGPRRLLAPLRPNKKNRDAAILHNILWQQKI